VLTVLALVGFLIFIGFSIRYVNPDLWYFYFGKITNKPLNPSQVRILKNYFPFYNLLPTKSKKIFEHKTAYFLQSKVFVPRRMKEVTIEMKLLISACAVQLTFGLPKVYMLHFKYIIVYPDAYYSNITKKYHKGEVNPRHKAIVLSWKAFVEGYIEKEGLNLGLHEMAHALHLENRIRNREYDFLPADALKKWDQMAENEINLIKEGSASFFRGYGATDHWEFFAVAAENFFERPHQFEKHSPNLYYTLCELLRQNPILLSA